MVFPAGPEPEKAFEISGSVTFVLQIFDFWRAWEGIPEAVGGLFGPALYLRILFCILLKKSALHLFIAPVNSSEFDSGT